MSDAPTVIPPRAGEVISDGRTPSFDQEPPPAEGTRPATDAVIGSSVDIEAIAIAEVQSAPGEPSPVPHVHHRHVQSFYVLEGELALTAGDRELRAQAGSWVDVPSGLPHAVSSSQPVRYLDLLAPS